MHSLVHAVHILPVLAVLASGCSLLIEPGDNAADGAETCTDIDVPIAERTDDGHIADRVLEIDGFSFTPENPRAVYMGYWRDTPIWGYFRFALPSEVHPDHQISLRFWTVDSDSWGPADGLRIAIEADADAIAVSSPNDAPSEPGGRELLATRVRWPEQGGLEWPEQQHLESPDLGPLLEKLSERDELLPGQHVQFWIAADFNNHESDVGAIDVFSAEDPDTITTLRFRCPPM